MSQKSLRIRTGKGLLFALLLGFAATARPSEWKALEVEAYTKSAGGWIELDPQAPPRVERPASALAGKWIRFSGEVEEARSDIVFLLHAYAGEKLLDYSRGICDAANGHARCEALLHVPDHAEKIGAVLWARSGKPARLRKLALEAAEGKMSPIGDSPRLNGLIDLFQKHYYRSSEVDWPALDGEFRAWPQPPEDSDPLPVIASTLLKRLPGHEHSSVIARNSVDGSAEEALPSCRRLAPGLWRLTLPELGAMKGPVRLAYARTAQRCLLHHPAATRWVLDLRQNSGGNMYPMLAGIAPLFKRGALLSFVDGKGHPVEWIDLRDGGIASNGRIAFAIRTGAGQRSSTRALVLTGRGCLSSCEAVLIALAKRPHTLLVGEPSGGLTSSNGWHELNADYGLVLTESLMADRSGHPAPAHIPPAIERKTLTPRSLKSLFSSPRLSERP